MTHPDGVYFTYHYDAGDRLTSIKENGSADIKNFLYDALGRLTLDGNSGFATSYGYDGIWRANSVDHNVAGTDYDLTLGFTFNAASQVKGETRSNDAYAWTAAYNVSRSYGVNGLNQYTAAGPATFAYDANANLTSDGTTNFVYDAENRLVSGSGDNVASLTYDPLGRLLQTSGGSGDTTQLLYDGNELVAEFDGGGNVVRRYVQGISVDDPVAWYEGSGLGSRRVLFANHQGSVVAVTDATGSSLARNSYDPWGIPGANNMGRFQYTGQAWIPELGMYYYKARIYSPRLGRFLQTDPVGYTDQPNLYAYVANDPINGRDPTGETCTGSRIEDRNGNCGGTGAHTTQSFVPVAARAAPGAVTATAAATGTAAATLGVLAAPLALSGDTAKYERAYITYTKENETTGEVYSGRSSMIVPTGTPLTRGLAQRILNCRECGHHMNQRGFGPARVDQMTKSYFAIRGREQQLIDHFGGAKSMGGSSGNAVNGISNWTHCVQLT